MIAAELHPHMAESAIQLQDHIPEGTLLAMALIDGRILSNLRRTTSAEDRGHDASGAKRQCGTSGGRFNVLQVWSWLANPLS